MRHDAIDVLLAEIDRRREMRRQAEQAEQHLLPFIRLMWRYVEPARELVEGWPLDALCDHLEAVTAGHIHRLLINVPPGFMKSLVANVFWPAWEWGPKNRPTLRYIAASYSQTLTVRDNVRFRNIIMSPLYRKLWGKRFGPSRAQFSIEKVSNDQTGWKLATSVGGVGTGERGDRFIIDDGNSVAEAESEAVTTSTNQWFREVVPTRLNDIDGVIINIQQRTNESDISGVILDPDSHMSDWVHLMIPMRYDSTRHCITDIGWQDPRGVDPISGSYDATVAEANDGALAWPARFPMRTVVKLEQQLGEYASAGQLAQLPTPRGGGIFKRHHWRDWPPEGFPERAAGKRVNFPPLEYVIASLDTALSQREEADYSALTIWGLWRNTGVARIPPRVATDGETLPEFLRLPQDDQPKCILMHAWQKRLQLHGPQEEKPVGMSDAEWNSPEMLYQRQKHWGLVQWVIWHGRFYRIDKLLVESKANGIDVVNEIQRLHAHEDWSTEWVDPKRLDKVARAYGVQHLWENGIIYRPVLWSEEDQQWLPPAWCSLAIDQFSIFPRGKHDDIVDSGMHALKYMRDLGLLLRRDEAERNFEDEQAYRPVAGPLYPT